jgi:hypothetical protein
MFSSRPWLLPTITGVAGVILGAVLVLMGGFVVQALSLAATSSVLADALEVCDVNESADAELGDGGLTLTVNMRGEDEIGGLDYTEANCIVDALNPPAAVTSHIDQTTSMDGRQSESWDQFSISWSYHPDRGFDYVLTVER